MYLMAFGPQIDPLLMARKDRRCLKDLLVQDL